MKELHAPKLRAAEVAADIKMRTIIDTEKRGSTMLLGNKTIEFARADMSEVDEIKKMPAKELKREIRNLDWLIFDHGQTSVHDCQRLALLGTEHELRRARRTRQTGREMK